MNAFTPEDIKLSALPSLPLSDRRLLPEVPCIYFAIDSQGAIQYIGRSVNLRQRWMGHHRYNQLQVMAEVKLVWLQISEVSLLPEVEKALIKWFKPPLNGSDAFDEDTTPKCGVIRVVRTVTVIKERIKELGLDLAALNRRFCEIKRHRGEDANPVNRRNMLKKALSEDGNPTLETFLDIVKALNGEVLIEWKDIKLRKLTNLSDAPDKEAS